MNRLKTAADWDKYNRAEQGRKLSPFELDQFRQRVPLKPGARVVDLGCGNGHWTRELATLGCDVVGYDWAPGTVKRAQVKRSLARQPHFEVWDIDAGPLPMGLLHKPVDLVTCRFALGCFDLHGFGELVGEILGATGRLYVLTDVRRTGIDLPPSFQAVPARALRRLEARFSSVESWQLGLREARLMSGCAL
ncbi:methyltransferase domain-containing protein [Streptomyces sp. NPDC089799]|uniref:class I SAM-dependent methyltransferase n=1 Tax=Streptomyces sp. NPDC089799 TaxID=3155066 RepID=UPI0034273554